jgi:hypothetical protein
MIYHWELATGHQIAVSNEGAQTVVTILQTSAGQQQRSTNSFTTGIWLSPPEMTMTPTGGILKISSTPSGESVIQIQGNNIHLQSIHSGANQCRTSTSSSSTLTSRIEPMPSMQMGNMQMNMSPMSMRMGDMELNRSIDCKCRMKTSVRFDRGSIIYNRQVQFERDRLD